MKITVRTNDAGGSIVTNSAGNPVHVLAYVPFGETLLDIKNGSYDEQYKFGGKMKDEESGLMYFSDRYYWDKGGIFITPDRLWHLSPHQSSYVYCSNDPINRRDPTGMTDYFNDDGVYLGNNGTDNGKVFLLNKGMRAKTENTNVNWGGTLSEQHANQLENNSTEVAMDSELGTMIRAVYAEMRGGDDNAKAIVAESIYNRSQLKDNAYEKADGTYTGIISKFYDVSKSKNVANDAYTNPIDYIYKNDKETAAWRSSIGAAIKADAGKSDVGKGVIFYNSNSSTYYDNNSKMQKITLDFTIKGIKGLWKLK